MAAKTDTIIVTVNYRLGALGFLAHPALSAQTEGGSGNYATMDQLESLRWVRRNIEGFGGDRGKVTIYGQSAGDQAVCNMLAIPSARASSSAGSPRARRARTPAPRSRSPVHDGLDEVGGPADLAGAVRDHRSRLCRPRQRDLRREGAEGARAVPALALQDAI
jgi:carboxylesterase type B